MCSVNLIDVSFPGVADPVLRKLTRNQILNPATRITTTTNEALKSMNSDNRDAFSEESVYIALVVGTVVLAVVLIIILLSVLTNMKKENSKFKTSPIEFKSRKDFVTTFNRLNQDRETEEADCEDLGHFSIEGRTREWLLEQGGRSVCRSCGEGRIYIEREGSCDTQGFRKKDIEREEDYLQKKTKKENSYFLSKKCSCGKCNVE